MIKVLFVEDNVLVRKVIIDVLRQQLDLEVVGEAENGVIALQLLRNGLQPDILLTDLNMPQMGAYSLLSILAIWVCIYTLLF